MEQMFKIGEDVTCKLDGMKGYIVEYFAAAMVSSEGKLKVIPERYLFRDDELVWDEKGGYFKCKKGRVVKRETFYVIHLSNGQLKIATSEILLKGHQKVVPVFSGKSLIKLKLN